MGRAPCCDKANVKRGPWSPEEDLILKNYLEKYGSGGNWISFPQKAGLKRCGKSCRLRWLNYLRPDIKHGGYSEEEDIIICSLYKRIGSRWSVIAGHLPGRTDNDVKNYWNTKLKKKLMAATSFVPTARLNSTTSKLSPSNLSATSTTVIAPSLDAPRRPLLHPAERDPDGAIGAVHDDVLPFVPNCPMPSLDATLQRTGLCSTDGGGGHVQVADPVSSSCMAMQKASDTYVHQEGMIDVPGDGLFDDVNWGAGDVVHGFCEVGYPALVDCDVPCSSVSGSMSSLSPASAGDLSSFTSLLAYSETNDPARCRSLVYPSY